MMTPDDAHDRTDTARLLVERMAADLVAFRIGCEQGTVRMGLIDRLDRRIHRLRDQLDHLQQFMVDLESTNRRTPRPPPPSPPPLEAV